MGLEEEVLMFAHDYASVSEVHSCVQCASTIIKHPQKRVSPPLLSRQTAGVLTSSGNADSVSH